MSYIYFLAGLGSIVSQTVLLRELLVVFSGSELTIGIFISIWLLGSASGSYLGGKFRQKPGTALGLSFVFSSVLMPLIFIVIRNTRNILGVVSGTALGFESAVLVSFMSLFPAAFFTGMQFSLGTLFFDKHDNPGVPSKIYLWESLGCLFGGLFFTFVLLNNVNPSGIILFCCIVFLLPVIKLSKKRYLKMSLAMVSIAFAVYMPSIANFMEQETVKLLYPDADLKFIVNSQYSQIAVSEKNNQNTVYINAVPERIFPDTDYSEQEEFAYIPLLFSSTSKKILIAGGYGKYIENLLNSDVEKLDYCELDPQVIDVLLKYETIADKRLSIFLSDAREFITEKAEKYDVVYIAVQLPMTLGQNRYYTKEFFRFLKAKLSPNGMAVFKMPGSQAYMDNKTALLNGSLKATLKSVFREVKIVPGETNIFMASDAVLPDENKAVLKLKSSGIKYRFLSEQLLKYRFSKDISRISGYDKKENINYDFKPVIPGVSIELWQSMFSGRARGLEFLKKYSWVLFFIVFLLFFVKIPKYQAAVFSSGVCAMGLQILFFWVLQIYSGGFYYWLGILTAVFMAGLAVGAYWAGLKNVKVRHVELMFFIWVTACAAFFNVFSLYWQLVFVFSFITAMLLGLIYPAVVKESGNKSPGTLYSLDVLGGWFASFMLGSLLLPFWGAYKTLFLLVLLKGLSFKNSLEK